MMKRLLVAILIALLPSGSFAWRRGGTPSAVLWTPAALGSSLKAQLVRQANGTYVDQSGNGHTFTGPDANGQYASETGWALPQPFTVVDIYTNAAIPNAYQITFAGDAASTSSTRAIVFERYSNGAPQLLGGSGNASFGTTISASASHILVATFNGANSFAAIDGVQSTALNTGTTGIINGHRTGGGDAGSYFNGTLKQRIIVSGALSSDDELRMEGYGAANGGGTLSSTHPFSNAAPTTGPIPVVSGSTVAQIAAGSNTARLGVYSGYAASNPDGSSSIPPSGTLFGAAPVSHKVFGATDVPSFSGSTANGQTVESSVLYALSQLKGRGLQVNLSIPNATGTYSSALGRVDNFTGTSLQDSATGAEDTAWTNIANYLVQNGFADDPSNPPMILPGQEMNGNWFPWGQTGKYSDDDFETYYKASARRMVSVMRPIFTAAGKSAWFGIALNKAKPNAPLPYSRNLARLWPGDDVMDFVSMDVYDDDQQYLNPQGYAAGTQANIAAAQRWTDSVLGTATTYQLAWLDLFSRTPNMRGSGFVDGKRLPIVIGEWGGGGPTSLQGSDYARAVAYSGGDDGTYTANMMQWFKDRKVYAHYFYDIFDTSIGYTGAVKWTPANTGMAAAGYASTTAVAIGTGSKTYTVASGLPFVVGMPVIVRSDASPSTVFIEATVTSYAGTTLVLNGFASAGSGSPAAVHILTHPNAVMPNSYAAIQAASNIFNYTTTITESRAGATVVTPAYPNDRVVSGPYLVLAAVNDNTADHANVIKSTASFPLQTRLATTYPADGGTSVRSFMFVDYGNYLDGTATITPAQNSNIATLTQAWDFTLTQVVGTANGALDGFLYTSSAGTTATIAFEWQVYWSTPAITKTGFLDTLPVVGTYASPAIGGMPATNWRVTYQASNAQGKPYVQARPIDGSGNSLTFNAGSFDIGAFFAWLRTQNAPGTSTKILTGAEYFTGFGNGYEALNGSVQLDVNAISTVYARAQ